MVDKISGEIDYIMIGVVEIFFFVDIIKIKISKDVVVVDCIVVSVE